jgi:hypothetical protein
MSDLDLQEREKASGKGENQAQKRTSETSVNGAVDWNVLVNGAPPDGSRI